VDEAHRLRTHIEDKDNFRRTGEIEGAAKTAKCLLKCARKAAKVLLLTATPVVNDPYDFANLAAMLRGNAAPVTKEEFHARLFSKTGAIVNGAALGGFLAHTTRPTRQSKSTRRRSP
jgi:hypothetical protein